MAAERTEPAGLLASLHSPRALLLGVAFSFLACCAAGEWVSRRGVYVAQRFHPRISIESFHYPTPRQVTAFTERRLDRERVAVVVGGNSVLYGFGQDEAGLWTRHLQEELGDGYRVVNLASRGAHPGEFGGVVAEILSRKDYKVIYLASFGSPGLGQSYVDGSPELYRYFFWDAHQRGLLRKHPAREEALALARTQRKDETFAELQRGTWIDRYLSSRDLWTASAYLNCSTVYSPYVRGSVLRPRRRYADQEPAVGGSFAAVPFEGRYPAARDQQDVAIVRSWAELSVGRLVEGADWVQTLRAAFPDEDRRRTLMIGVPDSPLFVKRLDSSAQALYWANFTAVAAFLEGQGFSTVTAGRDWTAGDFYDRCHLSARGGRSLAVEVAPKVRRMANELGYLEGR